MGTIVHEPLLDKTIFDKIMTSISGDVMVGINGRVMYLA